MKKIYLFTALAIFMQFLSSCSDEAFSERYDNPANTRTTSVDKLMAGVFVQGRNYTFNGYMRMYTYDLPLAGKFAQTAGFANSDNELYAMNDSYINERWSNFYYVLTQYRALENMYDQLPEIQKPTYVVFKHLAEIFVYDHLSQVVDVFGDVPFTGAGYLSTTGNLANSQAPYDKATDIYTTMLDRLGELSTEISRIKSNIGSMPAVSSKLGEQDFINLGDLDKWIRYCNSLRLRLAIRVSSQGNLATKGRQVVAEILNGNYPLVLTLKQAVTLNLSVDDTGTLLNSDDLRTGYAYNGPANPISWASQAMIDVLTKSVPDQNDPRLPIMYSKNAAGEYKGLSTSETSGTQSDNLAKSNEERVYSRIDSTTVGYNKLFMAPIITPGEVHFLKAEAYQNGWASGSVKEAFIDGIRYSTQFYFQENTISPSTAGTKMDIPKDSIIADYATKVWDNSTNKLETIITQKWLNFGFLQPTLAWNETRRTGYPSLTYLTAPQAPLYKTVPNRFRYPGSERSYNTTNYNKQVQDMGGTDDVYIKIFWAK